MIKKLNAGAMRVRGFLEIASALNDSSLANLVVHLIGVDQDSPLVAPMHPSDLAKENACLRDMKRVLSSLALVFLFARAFTLPIR